MDQFRLKFDKNKLLRCQGRIGNSSLPLGSNEPIILPSKHYLVRLLIIDVHNRLKHSGVNDTLTTLREQYWILKGRQTVKRVLCGCVICRKFSGPPYSTAASPNLPEIRVSEDPPFTHTGVDFAGPLYIKCRSNADQSDEVIKSYVCLFTCVSTRSIHLELAIKLNVNSFLTAFRRFAARRGLPATMISDNASTFKSASKEIRQIARSSDVHQYLIDKKTTWKFIIEHAPWWGGFWERMIRTVKACLQKTISRATLNQDELHTLLVEVESIVNSRPLTYVQDDQDGTNYSLTPSHLIYGRRIATSPNTAHFEVVSTHDSLTRRFQHHQRMLNHIINVWKRDYLLHLCECHRLNCKRQNKSVVAVGDIVLVKDDMSKRMFWKIAMVKESIPGRDSQIRAAAVRVGDSSRLIKRSLTHLIPLELNVVESS